MVYGRPRSMVPRWVLDGPEMGPTRAAYGRNAVARQRPIRARLTAATRQRLAWRRGRPNLKQNARQTTRQRRRNASPTPEQRQSERGYIYTNAPLVRCAWLRLAPRARSGQQRSGIRRLLVWSLGIAVTVHLISRRFTTPRFPHDPPRARPLVGPAAVTLALAAWLPARLSAFLSMPSPSSSLA